MRVLYVGRKAPKGWREVSGGVHTGRGTWLLVIEPAPKPKRERPLTHCQRIHTARKAKCASAIRGDGVEGGR